MFTSLRFIAHIVAIFLFLRNQDTGGCLNKDGIGEPFLLARLIEAWEFEFKVDLLFWMVSDENLGPGTPQFYVVFKNVVSLSHLVNPHVHIKCAILRYQHFQTHHVNHAIC